MGEVEAAFIQAPEHRPDLSIIAEAQGIPVIDLSPIHQHFENDTVSDQSAIEGVVKEVRRACKEWGFFQVTNHGVPLNLRQRVEDVSRKFFSQSLEEKKKVARDHTSLSGYYDSEHTKNVRDWKEGLDFLAKEPTLVPISADDDDDRTTQWFNRYPQNPPELRGTVLEYIDEMEKLAFKLLELIALSLGLESRRFHGYYLKDQSSFIRFNHYPACPSPHLALGVGRHKDPGALTILAQDEVEGLEVRRKSDQEWIRVKPAPQALIINVGEVVQVWSNDEYESAEHRVIVNCEKERFSIPFFFNPAHYTIVEPLKELINEQNPSKYRPYNFGKYLVKRKESNSQKQNVENLLISHFRLL
ncbi:probable 2-oxoglutarate-dependent dioxygenase At5g05600 [Neltuma alba]|uniref:probable 2-oxoglutarate-dependent dioxygenase At5g05600 n=1 Tax=Neltuma alba TaxID=207710 RepID=UPI0010A4EF65|nr:probable 2-oxoglutarate-dependent dioxygenase At5g05600 [Prosopis alba]